MGELAQVKNGRGTVLEIVPKFEKQNAYCNRQSVLQIAPWTAEEKIKNMLYKMLSDYNRKISAGLYNIEDSNNNN